MKEDESIKMRTGHSIHRSNLFNPQNNRLEKVRRDPNFSTNISLVQSVKSLAGRRTLLTPSLDNPSQINIYKKDQHGNETHRSLIVNAMGEIELRDQNNNPIKEPLSTYIYSERALALRTHIQEQFRENGSRFYMPVTPIPGFGEAMDTEMLHFTHESSNLSAEFDFDIMERSLKGSLQLACYLLSIARNGSISYSALYLRDTSKTLAIHQFSSVLDIRDPYVRHFHDDVIETFLEEFSQANNVRKVQFGS